MKITRLVHSCLLVEDSRANVLIDPGEPSYNDPTVQANTLPLIDYILITHAHEDHCSPNFINQVLKQSPAAKVFGNSEVVELLKEHGITVNQTMPDGFEMTNLKHAKHWRDLPQIDNAVFTLWGELTHFGDNRELNNVNFADIVAFPITAPWGSLADAIDRLIEPENPPKKVIPIHDWHLSANGQKWYYQRAKEVLDNFGIELLQIGPIDTIDI